MDKRRITDEQIKIFGDKRVSRLELNIKPEDLFQTMMNLLKDDDIVCDFFGCNETIVYGKNDFFFILLNHDIIYLL